ncbi:hypothetical protein OOZ63_01500 [Paucibacter sp. PLA-PC-4]|uniref:hypothetical protein n=1 Tax=Paucibacter sp. PLA-PC-4 TaxID=2993655 RepID=UPI002249425E|nr:hypothetical protein [Paucibacter sp. PLA-PC-4]MCX2860514.1 hypothetical protein [Paucibacter sp. PLA-PC-4]
MAAHATILVSASLLPLANAWSQSVHKCTVDRKASHQTRPCAGQGQSLTIAPGPTEQDQKQARARADAQKARLGSFGDASTRGGQPQPVGQQADCAHLNKARGEAFGRRNAAVRSSRQSSIDNSGAVGRSHYRIVAIESRMMSGGCRPN